MANSGPNTNGSQFYMTFDAAPHLNHKHTVFGRVVGGMEVLDAIEKVDTIKSKTEARPKDAPRKDITITAVTVFDNPFRAEFIPIDELTRKKENEAALAAAQAEKDEALSAEKGLWFSNPSAESARPALSGNDTFKYLNLPKDAGAKQQQANKRKGSPNAATPTDEAMGVAASAGAGAGGGHPALRAAASPGAAMDTAQTPKAIAASADDDEAAAFEAARKRQMQAKAAAAAQKPATSSYGNFGNF